MELQNVELFKGVTCASIDAMMSCFRPEVRKFKKGDTILVFEPEIKSLCVLLSGKAHLYCVDSEGEYTLLENYGVNDIFGRYSTRLLPLVRHAAEVRIRTHAELDDFCQSCILRAGTCPFVSKYPSVIDHCELLFDPYGAGVEAGTVFGKGGCSVDPDALRLPERYKTITRMGVDAIDLAALLSLESEAFAPENCMPTNAVPPLFSKAVP